jgi:hypothetical protein
MQPVSIDFSGLGNVLVDALVAAIKSLVEPLPQDFERWMLNAIQSIVSAQDGKNLLTQIPLDWTAHDKDVIALFKAAVDVGAGAKLPLIVAIAVLVMVVQGLRVMAGRVEMWEAMGRTAFLVFVGCGMLWLSEQLISAVDALASAVGTVPISVDNADLPTSQEAAFLLIIAAFFAALTWVKGAVGVVFIKVLIVAAPYLIPLSALPLLEGLGTWWAEEFTTWLLRPFMVALVLRLGLGTVAIESGPMGLLFAIVTFWLAYTMDTRIRRLSMGAWGSVGQLNVFARGARYMAGAFGGGPVAAPAAAAASAAHP